jgi:hypothetical protein
MLGGRVAVATQLCGVAVPSIKDRWGYLRATLLSPAVAFCSRQHVRHDTIFQEEMRGLFGTGLLQLPTKQGAAVRDSFKCAGSR